MDENDALILLAVVAGAGLVWLARRGDRGDRGDETAYSNAINMANTWKPPASAGPYLNAIAEAEALHGLPVNMLASLLYQESRYRPEIINGTVKSPAGALGIAQFMPATAKQFGINPLDPFQAIPAAAKYLAKLYKRFGNWPEALAAYN